MTISSNIPSNLTIQGANNRKGLSYQGKIEPTGSHGKADPNARNKVHKPLCTHCGRDGHMKKNY